MTKLIRIFYIVLILAPFSLEGQKEILVALDKNEKIIVIHEVQPGETFFGISRDYGLNVDQLIKHNQLFARAGLSPGDPIQIYFNPEKISTHKKGNSHTLIYEVTPGTTLFAIRRASGTPIPELKKINNLKSSDLRPGQKLIIGYYNTDPISPLTKEIQKAEINESIAKNDQTSTITDNESPGTIVHEEINLNAPPSSATIIEMNYEEQRGVAVWNQDWKSTSGFYVLHKDAPINSIIEIENPMFGRKAFGKVSGRIPSSLYSSDVILIVSDALARHLGVIDQRFFVKVRYLQAD